MHSLLALIFLLTASAQGASFPDVAPGSEYFDAVSYLQSEGIMNGFPNGTFGTSQTMNRAELATVMVRALFPANAIEACSGVSFPDIPSDAWYKNTACMAKQYGIIDGFPDGTFRGSDPVNVAQAAKIIVRSQDVTIAQGDPWYAPFMQYLSDRNAIPTQTKTFTSNASRGLIAEMFYRLRAHVTTKNSRTFADMNAVPAVQHERRKIQTGNGTFDVDIVMGDLSKGVKIVTDSANSGNCDGGCPALTLSEYIDRNNAVAGIHGSYFCPPDYSQCANTVNSYIYFVYAASAGAFVNSEKRSYDNAGGLFVFRNGSAEFTTDPTSFNLDTNITGAIAMWPALVAGGQPLPDHFMMDEKQRTGRGAKGGLGVKGSTVYFLLARNTTVPDLREIMLSLGLESGINLDGGGSSAVYADGAYKVGPGRKLPNAILMVQ